MSRASAKTQTEGRKRSGTTTTKGVNDPMIALESKPATVIKKGYLQKRGKVNTGWKKRYFILSEKHLYYYVSPEEHQKGARFTGAIQLLFSSFRPLGDAEAKELGVASGGYCFKIITPVRVFYLSASTEDEAKGWIDSLTQVSATLWEKENQTMMETCPPDILKKGWLQKQGNSMLKDWKQRWFVLRQSFIAYYKDPEDPTPLGTIPLLQCSVKISETVSKKNCFEFVTPNRTFYAVAKDAKELLSWMDAIKQAIALTLETFFEDNAKEAKAKKESNLSHSTASQISQESNMTRSMDEYDTDSLSSKASFPDADSEDVYEAEATEEQKKAQQDQLAKGMAALLELDENKFCAECNMADPKWASINLGIFVCIECSGIHRSLGVHLSKVRSVDLDVWEADTVEFMESMGNKKSREIWEYNVPTDCVRPSATSSRQQKDKWIKMKYEERRFADPDIIKPEEYSQKTPEISQAPAKEGFLTKQGPKEELIKTWKLRWFILKNNYLYYYVSREDTIPTGAIRLEGASVRVAATAPKPNCFEISTKDRDYLISAEIAADMFEWIKTIKQSISFFAGGPPPVVEETPAPSNDWKSRRKSVVLKEDEIRKRGYIYKRGNSIIKDIYKKRWLVLYRNCLYYYEDELDTLPLGVIELDKSCELQRMKPKQRKYFFDLITPGRTWGFYSEVQRDFEEWLKLIQEGVDAPLVRRKKRVINVTNGTEISANSPVRSQQVSMGGMTRSDYPSMAMPNGNAKVTSQKIPENTSGKPTDDASQKPINAENASPRSRPDAVTPPSTLRPDGATTPLRSDYHTTSKPLPPGPKPLPGRSPGSKIVTSPLDRSSQRPVGSPPVGSPPPGSPPGSKIIASPSNPATNPSTNASSSSDPKPLPPLPPGPGRSRPYGTTIQGRPLPERGPSSRPPQ
eukprot:TRINITY_DN2044_c0_g1_i4.p1 TRINITY_DN2044_c0_g1~~TRINITY_DN2044_c0_g1_i4.p1  ORF type:complete len:915 (-),score=256.98 TRINITY_DN2044_c0_g1_i4:1531-4275(-)